MLINSQFTDWLSDNWITILIVVGSVVVGVWLIAFIFAISFYNVFKKALRRESDALNMLLKERHQTLHRYIELAKKHNIEISQDEINGVNRLERINDFQALDKVSRDERIFSFIKASQSITVRCHRNEDFIKDEEYELIKNMYLDLEDAYRQKCAKYNSDVLGYNYWIRIPGTRLIFKIAKIRKKDLIV